MSDRSAQSPLKERLAEYVYRLATEGQTPGAQAAAIGLGLLIGCSPLFGFHLILAVVVARVLGLSRVRMVAAGLVSNPLLAPFLMWGEFQVGSRILRGRWRAIVPGDAGLPGIGELGADLLVGWLVVGSLVGLLGALAVWLVVPKGPVAALRRRVIEGAAYRFLKIGYREWWRTRRELCRHPELALRAGRGEFAPGGRFLDLGCGDGAMLAAVLEAEEGRRPEKLMGVTLEATVSRQTEIALGSAVTMEVADPASRPLDQHDAVVVWETRRRRAPVLDDRLLERIHTALNGEGLLVVAALEGRMPQPEGESLNGLLERMTTAGFEVEVSFGRRQSLQRPVLVVGTKAGK